MLQSVDECFVVFLRVADCCGVFRSFPECYLVFLTVAMSCGVLRSVAGCCEDLRSVDEYFSVLWCVSLRFVFLIVS